ncbi:hypothetical protein BC826DRAFT_107585 [Russula brevipes]|nr:hypothetical protein BC826DRAFT_107585 [Russula brevipes]
MPDMRWKTRVQNTVQPRLLWLFSRGPDRDRDKREVHYVGPLGSDLRYLLRLLTEPKFARKSDINSVPRSLRRCKRGTQSAACWKAKRCPPFREWLPGNVVKRRQMRLGSNARTLRERNKNLDPAAVEGPPTMARGVIPCRVSLSKTPRQYLKCSKLFVVPVTLSSFTLTWTPPFSFNPDRWLSKSRKPVEREFAERKQSKIKKMTTTCIYFGRL